MRAVVLDVRDGYAAVLRDDGIVEKIRRSCRVGETIEMADKKILSFPQKMIRGAVAAAAALILLTAGGTYQYNNAYAYSYVTMDINPSIEYVLNRRNEVLRVTALNEDAQPIVAALNEEGVKKSSLTGVIRETTTLLYESEYLGADKDNCVLISVTSTGATQSKSLVEEVETCYSDNDELDVYVTVATTKEAKEAKSLGISTGRYKIAEEISGESGVTKQDADRVSGAAVRALIEERTAMPAPPEGPGAPAEPVALPGQGPTPGDSLPTQPEPAVTTAPPPMTEAPAAPSAGTGAQPPANPGVPSIPQQEQEEPVPESVPGSASGPTNEADPHQQDGIGDGNGEDPAEAEAPPEEIPSAPAERMPSPAYSEVPEEPPAATEAPAAPAGPEQGSGGGPETAPPSEPEPGGRNQGDLFWSLVDAFFEWM